MDDGEDRISGLPDVLLHCILVRLGSARAAARTRVLSRRWRPETGGYQRFLNETNKLPKCETLSIVLARGHHGLAPAMMHLLRGCSSTRKLFLELSNSFDPSQRYSCPSSCPCRLSEFRKIDGIALDSLEVVEISSWPILLEELEFFAELSICKAAVLKKLVIKETKSAATLTKKLCEVVRRICHPDLEIEFYVLSGVRLVRFD
ncbi:hypothetical protein EJB05_30244, partial [Eragrostis curvula]